MRKEEVRKEEHQEGELPPDAVVTDNRHEADAGRQPMCMVVVVGTVVVVMVAKDMAMTTAKITGRVMDTEVEMTLRTIPMKMSGKISLMTTVIRRLTEDEEEEEGTLKTVGVVVPSSRRHQGVVMVLFQTVVVMELEQIVVEEVGEAADSKTLAEVEEEAALQWGEIPRYRKPEPEPELPLCLQVN